MQVDADAKRQCSSEEVQEESESDQEKCKRVISPELLGDLIQLRKNFEASPSVVTFRALVLKFPQELIDEWEGPKVAMHACMHACIIANVIIV